MEKIFVGESEAKAIVRGFMRQYQYTLLDLNAAVKNMIRNVKSRPNSVAKREDIFRKHFHKHSAGVICKQIRASFSPTMKVFVDRADSESIANLSKAKQKRRNIAINDYHRHLLKVKDNIYNVFVVRLPDQDKLMALMFCINPSDKLELMVLEEVMTISRHCLERIIERLNLKSVDKAIDEIFSGMQNIHSTNKELSERISVTRSSFSLKRHIPTNNGALLLACQYDIHIGAYTSNLVTWIHKKQFIKDQEVTKNEFNFVQQINLVLTSPDKDTILSEDKIQIAKIRQDIAADTVAFVVINGVSYPWEDFIYHLEKGEYLDFMIDFEKF